MFTLHGNGVGSGIAIGTARIIRRPGQDVPKYRIDSEQVEEEVVRLEKAIAGAESALKSIDDQLPADAASEVRAILGAHLLMLQDPMLSREPAELIRSERINAEAALQQHAQNLEKIFSAIDDPYLSSKSADVAQVIDRVQGELMDRQDDLTAQPVGRFDGEIIVANDLTPADAIEL